MLDSHKGVLGDLHEGTRERMRSGHWSRLVTLNSWPREKDP